MKQSPGRRHLILLASSTVMLSACGFRLRGSANLPFTTMYINSSSAFAVELSRTLRTSSNVKSVSTPQEAEAIIELTGESLQKDILSLNAQGRPREYKLTQSVTIRVYDSAGRDYIKATTLQQTREVSFNENQVLAKEAEEALLYRDMQSALVQQILRHLANIRKNMVNNDK